MGRARTLNSPVGIALAAAGLILALSPEARRAVSRLLFKGTTAMMGAGGQSRDRAEVSLERDAQRDRNRSAEATRRAEMTPEEAQAADEIAQMLGEDFPAADGESRHQEQSR